MSHATTPIEHTPRTPQAPDAQSARPAIEANALTRAFGRRVAIRGLTFAVNDGECLALFGPNGAGKTTLLRILAGLLRPTSGAAHIAGVKLPGGA